MRKGTIAAFATYLIWGFSPLYWKIISHIPAAEILVYRVFWSIPFLAILFAVKKDVVFFKTLILQILNNKIFMLSAALLMINWLVWIWSINNGFIVDASLGYFINPLLNVVMGVILLHERLRKMQWAALSLAAAGVLYLAINYGRFPWIALILAGTFALYGYIRKTSDLGAFKGLTIEVHYMLIPAMVIFFYLGNTDGISVISFDIEMHIWIALTGLITVVPLTIFAYAARRIPYSTLGFIQYIAPTTQFLLGVYLYNEDFNQTRLIGFSFIWLALLFYSIDNLLFVKRNKKNPGR
jgi:chloramphenicol-sensitive protein RarD